MSIVWTRLILYFSFLATCFTAVAAELPLSQERDMKTSQSGQAMRSNAKAKSDSKENQVEKDKALLRDRDSVSSTSRSSDD